MPNHKNDDHIYDGNDDSQINDRTIVIGQSVEYGDDEKEIITKRGTVTRIRGKLELDDEDIEFKGTTRYDKVEIGGDYGPDDRPLQVYSGSKENELFNIEAVDANNNFKTTLGTDLIVNGDIIGGNGTLNVKSDLVVGGDLYIDGTLTTTNAKVLEVDDYQIILGNTSEEGGPSDSTASGGGIILRGTKDKTILWDATNGWKSSEKITASKGFVGDLDGNASTVTNGVYTSGNQTINGVKKFSSTIDGSISGNAGTVTNGVYTNTAQTITGVKTFNSIPIFNGGTSGSTAPFKVDSTFLVENLNADLLDGQEGSYYRDASNINDGVLKIARGGTNITEYDTGDILYASAANVLSKLAKGTNGQVLKINSSGLPAWGTDNNTVTRLKGGNHTTNSKFVSGDIELVAGNNNITVTQVDNKITINSNHNHDSTYLKLAGGTITGNLTVNGNTTLGNDANDITKVTGRLDVDNLRLDGNVLSSTNTNGNISITPAGAGKVIINGDLEVSGITTSVDVQDIHVADHNIIINDGVSQTAINSGLNTNDSGLKIRTNPKTSGTPSFRSILWNQTNTRWNISNDTNIAGNLTTTGTINDYTLGDISEITAPSTNKETTFLRGDKTWGTAVTSVGLSVPTGLSVAESPITTSGTLAISLASGYSIPTTNKQGQWDTAYGWGNHASAGYIKSFTNNYLTGVSGSGNGTVTFTRNGLSNLTWNAGHAHGDIKSDGSIGTTSGQVLVTTTNGKITTQSRSGIDSNVPSWARTAAPSVSAVRFMRMNANNTITWRNASDFRSDIGAASASHNHSATNITSGTLSVSRGGTGRGSLTNGAFVIGNGTNGTSAVTMQGNSSDNRVSGTKYFTNLDLSENLNFASDERMKSKHFKFDDKDMLKKLSSVDIYEYNFLNKPDETKIGLMAQDLQESFPEIELVENNGYNEEYDLEDSLAIKHDKLTYVLWSALKGANERIDELEERLSKLEGLINKE